MTTRGPTAVPSWCAPRLRLLTPDGATVRPLCVDLPMADAEIVLGRDATSTIRLPDPWVSRRHAMISMRQGRLVLEDLGSRWGTRLHDGALTGARPLVDGDAFVIGGTSVVIEHPWKGVAIERLHASTAREGSTDGLSLFDSVTRRLPPATIARGPAASAGWEQWLGVVATVLLATCAAFLAWRLLAGL